MPSKPIFLRLPPDLYEAIEALAEDIGLSIQDTIRIAVNEKLRELKGSEKLSTTCRLAIINTLIEQARREEEKAYKAMKVMLRSHPKGYLIRDLNGLTTVIEKDRVRLERLRELIKDPGLKEAIEAFLNEKAYYARRIAELEALKRKILKKELGKDYRTIEELIEEAESNISPPPTSDNISSPS